MIRVVLDTNVVVSALLWSGSPFAMFEAATGGDLLLYTSPALLAELRAVLMRGHLAMRLKGRHTSVQQALSLYAALAGQVTPAAVPRVVTDDPDDDHVLAAAVAAAADLIVSGDRHLLALGHYQGTRIVNPAETVRLLVR